MFGYKSVTNFNSLSIFVSLALISTIMAIVTNAKKRMSNPHGL
jgi:hypothetical protein